MSQSTERPTHVRHLIIATATCAAVLLYLERVCLSVAAVYIREDLLLSDVELGWAMGVFFWAYAAGQVPSGWLTDRFGPRKMMTVYLVGWSVFGISIALANNLWTLLLARLALGLSQAGAYPTLTVLVKHWVPRDARGWASSVVAFGGRAGGAGANLLTALLIVGFVPSDAPTLFSTGDVLDAQKLQEHWTSTKPAELNPLRERLRAQLPGANPSHEQILLTLNALLASPNCFEGLDATTLWLSADARSIEAVPIADRNTWQIARYNRLVIEKAFPGSLKQLHGAGWRPTLLVYGAGGVLMGLVFWFMVRDWPREHRRCNEAEAQLITAGEPPALAQTGKPESIPWRALALNWNMTFNSLAQFFVNFGWVFIITLSPTYLADEFSVPIEERGWMTTVPLVVSCGGMLFGGWLTDWLTRTLGLRWGRALPFGGSKVVSVIALAACPWLDSPWAVTVALSAMAFATDLGVPSIWAFAQDVGGRHVGSVVGWGNMWGNLGAGLGPIALAWAQKYYGWNVVFYLSALACAIGMLAGLLIRADQPLFADE
ncbi:MAG: MFS transporter [Planctomycetes bacterium]|nr:MFS transporter [Planctomycetota bacterium]